MQIIRDKTIPVINNRRNFLIPEIPNYHPSSVKYLKYWKKEKQRCIEGFWGVDDSDVNIDPLSIEDKFWGGGSYRFMPPKLYWYVNYGTIRHRPDHLPRTAPKIKIRPYLRDLEWAYFYNEIEARGFSGFELDKEYSCNNYLKDSDEYTDAELTEMCKDQDGNVIQLKYSNYFKEDGTRKTYISVREYIRQLFNKPLGIPIYENEAKNLMLLGSRGGGKLLNINELVRVQNGWEKIGNLKKGDKVYGSNGKLTKVINVSDVQQDMEMYTLTLRDGRTIDACKNHTWKVYNKNTGEYEEKQTEDLFNNYYNTRIDSKHKAKYNEIKYVKEYKFAIPNSKELISEKEQVLEIHPYVLGCLLGDGNFTTKRVNITSTDNELIKKFEKLLPKGYKLSKCKGKPCYNIIKKNKEVEPFWKKLERLDLMFHKTICKFIPEKYLFSSLSQRKELLYGLMDTYGFSDDRHIEFYTISQRLSSNFQDLVRSLGISCKSTIKKASYIKNGKRVSCKDCYRISLYTNKPVFFLKRKLKYLLHEKSKAGQSKWEKSFIIDIKKTNNQTGVCIMVDNEDHTYITKDYIVTHNSFLTSAICAHEWLFDGAKYYNEESIKNPAVAEILVGAALSSKSSEILQKVSDMLEFMPGNYSNDTVHPFYKEAKGTLSPNNFKNPFRHEYDKKIAGKWKKFGSQSKILHATFTVENPEAAAGTRPGIIVIEEVGLAPNILTIHGSNTAAQMTDGVVKFGSSIYIGTGGNMEKIVESELIFRDPNGFSMLEFDDVWEGSGKICWFVPAYYMDGKYKDINGNTKLSEAIKVYEKRRIDKKKARSSSALDLEMMNYPLKPSEMFINKAGNRFPIAELKQQLIEVTTKTSEYKDKHWTGGLIFNSKGELEFKPDEDYKVVRKYPILDNNNLPGLIEFFEMPKRNQENIVFPNRYFLGTDTYDDDESSTNSLGCIIIFDSWTKRIVAEFTGRPSTKEFYETTRKLTLFYNGMNNYENNKKGLFWHYEKKKSLNLLAETPESLRDEANVNIRRVGNTKYGTPVGGSKAVTKYGIQLIEMWLEEQAFGKEEHITNVQMIRSEGILRELIAYNPGPDHNFDRIMALIMVLILAEDKYRIIDNEKKRQSGHKENNLADDPFFTKNYDRLNTNMARVRKRENKTYYPNAIKDF